MGSGAGPSIDRATTSRSYWPPRKRTLWGGAVIGTVILVTLFLSTLAGGWAPLLHWSCRNGEVVASEVAWLPAILVNSPYGGSGSGNSSIPPGFIVNGQGIGSAVGLPVSNGTVGGVFVHVSLNLSPLESSMAWGPGFNSRCASPWTISASVDFTGSQVYSGNLGNDGNISDASQPNSYNFSSGPGDSTTYFMNGYAERNSANISTCGTGPERVEATSGSLTTWVAFEVGSHRTVVAYNLPFTQTFDYSFPANFGTWAVDNLSSPGGPGGGWAFSFSPCA
jgi:hypothetical protein